MDRKVLSDQIRTVADSLTKTGDPRGFLVAQAADVLQTGGGWEPVTSADQLPQGVYKEVTRGDRQFKQFVPVKFLARAACGAVTLTNVLEDGRVNFLAVGELPVAIIRIPEFK